MLRSLSLVFLFLLAPIDVARAQMEDVEFFESKIRPLLAKRCYSCHSAKAKKLQAGLYLDRKGGAIKGGESGPAIVPGKPDESLLVKAIRYEEHEMPPDAKLADAEIALLVKWVALGAPWSEERAPSEVKGLAGYDWKRFRAEHWSFRPVEKPARPKVADKSWALTELDTFILSKLEAAGLKPVSPAEPRTLVRRMYLDLTGILPTPDDVGDFVEAAANDRRAAIAALVDRLLESPHYGERWGRHWLDVARYSDGYGGFLDNAGYPHAWRYRDWVVSALNVDLPYDEFVRLQIAGDLSGEREDATATGFFALGPTYKSDGEDPDSVAQAKGETLDDRVDTLSRAFLGLTVSCARCHDHKFDPIPQQDYYSLAGIFNNTQVREAPLAPEDVVKTYNDHHKAIQDHDKNIKALQKKAKDQKRELNDNEKAQLADWQRALAELKKTAPPKYDVAHALIDTGSTDMPVALRGNLRKPGEVAPRRFLQIVAGGERPHFANGSGRVELAEAITEAANPLTARVIVNRVWRHHFGKGLVRSPSNFGTLGEEPTHPQLLDWLAATLVESDWSLKSLHRLIMNSAVYQLGSQYDEQNFAADGDNRLVWRMNPRRMDAEAWRDSLLAATGELDRTPGGPPIDNITTSNRRSLYAKVSRNGDVFASDEFLRLFDFPLMRATIAKRPTSIVPQQFLFMMNSEFMVGRARALAARLESEAETDVERIQIAYGLLYGRAANQTEVEIGLGFLNDASPQKSASPEVATDVEKDADILIADFDGETYGPWKVAGEAFGPGPARGTLPGQMVVTGFAGRGLVNSFFKGDGTTGRLTSPAFRIERRYMKFLIGGGKYPGETCINLLVDKKVVRTATGPNDRGGGSERLDWHVWDLQVLAGKNAVIEIVDNRTGGWGHVNVDHLVLSKTNALLKDLVAGESKSRGELPRLIQYTQALLSSNEFMFVR
jgi:hypothetical protein